MSRYDTHVERLKSQVEDLQAQLANRNLATALKTYSMFGILPKSKFLKAEVLRYHECIQQMIATLPTKKV